MAWIYLVTTTKKENMSSQSQRMLNTYRVDTKERNNFIY